MIKIITPSTGLRPNINWELAKNRQFVVAENEADIYTKRGLNVAYTVPNGLSRSQVRRLIIETETAPFYMIDDDIEGFTKWEYPTTSSKLSVEEAVKLIEHEKADYHDIIAMFYYYSRLTSYSVTDSNFMSSAVIYKAYRIDPCLLKQNEINFRDEHCLDDVELSLECWRKHIPLYRYKCLYPIIRYTKDKDSNTWHGTSRMKAACQTYLRWGNAITLETIKYGNGPCLNVKSTIRSFKKYFSTKREISYDEKLKTLIENALVTNDFTDVYNYVKEKE